MKCITVPLSLSAMGALAYDQAPQEDLADELLDADAFSGLWAAKVFEGIYHECGVFIDDYEDAALIGAHSLDRLIAYLDSLSPADPATRRGLATLRQQAQRARDLRTGVFFYF